MPSDILLTIFSIQPLAPLYVSACLFCASGRLFDMFVGPFYDVVGLFCDVVGLFPNILKATCLAFMPDKCTPRKSKTSQKRPTMSQKKLIYIQKRPINTQKRPKHTHQRDKCTPRKILGATFLPRLSRCAFVSFVCVFRSLLCVYWSLLCI